MFKLLFFSMGCLAVVSLTGCSPLSQPINVSHLSNSEVIYAVESTVHADSIRVKDLRGNTICLKRNLELTAPQASANFGFCTVTINSPYDVETRVGNQTYIARICAKE